MQLGFSRALGAALITTSLVAGCASGPAPAPVVTPQEQRARDFTAGSTIAQEFDSQIRMRKDIELQIFLRKIATRLSENEGQLSEAPLGVFIVEDRGRKPRNYGLPGNRIYLSAEFLRASQYENEVAAGIALELAHIYERSLLDRLEASQQVRGESVSGVKLPAGSATRDFFGSAGIFAFSDHQWSKATATAVRLLYSAGYDPRGIAALCDRFEGLKARSPINAATIAMVRERTRAEIARFSPLRNPIVRSEDFIRLQKRMERL